MISAEKELAMPNQALSAGLSSAHSVFNPFLIMV